MKILLIIPPMTQLNTPYPATAYLTRFLRDQGYQVEQRDLAIELLLDLLSTKGLSEIYTEIENRFTHISDDDLPNEIYHFFIHFTDIQRVVEPCIRFLQGKDPSLALRICSRNFLPEGPAFDALYQLEEQLGNDTLTQAFGDLGLQDKAKYLATLFINDLCAIIQTGIDPLFEVSRYGEQLAVSAPLFDPLYEQLHQPETLVQQTLKRRLIHYLDTIKPDVMGLSVPFPGNLLSALQIAQYCKQHAVKTKIVLGGGYPNTELRDLKDPRIFEFVDFITLDDGERPFLSLLEYLQNQRPADALCRTYQFKDQQIVYHPQPANQTDFPHQQTGFPSYDGLPLDRYLSLCEMLNPMHRIWSDGRWNKLTLAHGCYWKKCSFCDISLDYIRHYDDAGADMIVDRMEQIIQETGQTGFHFVDEAAPPKLLFSLAEKLIERQLVVTWWGNIRFEKTFTAERCQRLADSGCIAVSGGLEVASDRLLKLMKKGVSVEQVARVTRNFVDAGILVHAYLMYGFPSQTEQETVDALELVRQMMLAQCFQSAYWHRFSCTVHSPVGQHPEEYGIQLMPPAKRLFAENGIDYQDSVETDHEHLGQGLKKALYNYMLGLGFDYPVSFWFEHPVPEATIPDNFIQQALQT
jgi:radical SAM superfamily enzyme YgiQ (UPF0313 family)